MKAKFLAGIGLATVLALGGPAWAQDKAGQKFIKEAIEGNLAEVQMGQLAQKNGSSEGVRSYGQMLEQDHGDANKKAAAAASSVSVTPPAEPSKKQKADYDRMAKMTGTRFDSEFAKHMVADHKKDISEYEKAAKKNDAVGSYANETLPTLRKHLERAQSLTGSATTGRR
jgi:putative membrane protein